MTIDGHLIWEIVEKAILLAIGAGATYLLERRTRLIVYFSHVGAFRITPQPPGQQLNVHTHSVVVRNGGRQAAHNVRVPHRVTLAPQGNVNVSIWPNIAYTRTTLLGGGEEIQFDTLAPRQEVTISYLYMPPLTFTQIHSPITCDEMMAKQITVLPTYQLPRWARNMVAALLLLGTATAIYLVILLVRLLWPMVSTWG
jgi:hypothetical protein